MKKPIKWPSSPSAEPLTEKAVLKLYVDTLSKRNHIANPLTGLTPIQQREVFMQSLSEQGIPFAAKPPEQDFARLSVTVFDGVSDYGRVIYFSPNAMRSK
jgi:hypothetical protein